MPKHDNIQGTQIDKDEFLKQNQNIQFEDQEEADPTQGQPLIDTSDAEEGEYEFVDKNKFLDVVGDNFELEPVLQEAPGLPDVEEPLFKYDPQGSLQNAYDATDELNRKYQDPESDYQQMRREEFLATGWGAIPDIRSKRNTPLDEKKLRDSEKLKQLQGARLQYKTGEKTPEPLYEAALGRNINKILDNSNRLREIASQTEGLTTFGEGLVRGIKDYFKDYAEVLEALAEDPAMDQFSLKIERYNKGEDVDFTDADIDLLTVMLANEKLHKELDGKIPTSAKVGEAVGQSVAFGGEFALSGGVLKALGSSVKIGGRMGKALLAYEKLAGGGKGVAGVLQRGLLAKAAPTAVQIGFTPTFYKEATKKMQQGESAASAIWNAYFDTGIDLLSEKIFLKNPFLKNVDGIKKGAFKNVVENIGIAIKDKKGFLGVPTAIAEEFAEEKIAELAKGVKDITGGASVDDVYDRFTDWEQNKITLYSVAAMAGPLSTVNEGINLTDDLKAKLALKRSIKRVDSDLKGRIDLIINEEGISIPELSETVEREVIADVINGNIKAEDGGQALLDATAYTTWKLREVSKERYQQLLDIQEKEKEEKKKAEPEPITTTSGKVDYLRDKGVDVDALTVGKVDSQFQDTKEKEAFLQQQGVDTEGLTVDDINNRYQELQAVQAEVQEEPATGPTEEAEVVEQPVQEEPVQEQPVQEEPVQEQPVQEQPIQEEPVQEEPVQEEPIQEEPVQEEPVQEEPEVKQEAEKPIKKEKKPDTEVEEDQKTQDVRPERSAEQEKEDAPGTSRGLTEEDSKTVRDLPPDRRLEETENIESKAVWNELTSRLGRVFPNVNVYQGKKAFEQALKESGYTGKDRPSGFIGKDGAIYLDPEKRDAKAAVEEFSHLWVRLARQASAGDYKVMTNLVQDSKYYNDLVQSGKYKDASDPALIEEAISKAIADKGAQFVNRSKVKKIKDAISNAISKPLRTVGFTGKLEFFKDDIGSIAQKASKELLGEVPLTNLSSEDFAKIRDGRFEKTISTDTYFIRTKGQKQKKIEGPRAFVAGSILGERGRAQKFSDWLAKNTKVAKDVDPVVFKRQQRAIGMMSAAAKQTEFIVKDFNKALKKYTKSFKNNKEGKAKTQKALDDIQRVLTKHSQLTPKERIQELDLPEDLKQQTLRMRAQIDNLTKKLRNSNVLVGEDIEAVLNKNLGFYLHRSYAKHDVPNYAQIYKDYLGDEKMEYIEKYLRSKFTDARAKAVKFKATDVQGDYTMTFTNKYGFETEPRIFNINYLKDYLNEEQLSQLKRAVADRKSGKVFFEQLSEFPIDDAYVQFTSSDLNEIMKSIVSTKNASELIAAGKSIKSEKLGMFDTSILKERGDIAEPIRMLMGEYLDPRVNFAKTMMKMTNLYQKGRLFNDMYEFGKGSFFTDKKNDRNTEKLSGNFLFQKQHSKYAKEIWTTPELKELLEPDETTQNKWYVNAILTTAGIMKSMVTVGSSASQARNFIGAALNLMSMGNMPINLAKTFRIAYADKSKFSQASTIIFNTPLALGYMGSFVFKNTPEAEIKRLHADAVARGVLGESISVGVIKEIIDKLNAGKDVTESANFLKNSLEKGRDNALKVYEVADDIFKLSAYLQEQKRYKKIYPNKTDGQIKDIAAQKVRDFLPTYSLAPKYIKRLSANPVIGGFVMFTAELVRNRVNLGKSILEDAVEGFKTKNTKLIRLAMWRAASALAVDYGLAHIGDLISLMNGWTDEDDEDQAAMSSDFEKNAQRVYLNDDKKNPLFMRISNIVPSGPILETLNAISQGADATEKLFNAYKALKDIVANEEILFKTAKELSKGKTEFGKAIVHDSMSNAEKWARYTLHAMKNMMPALIYTIRDISRGYEGYVTSYGKEYSMYEEVLNATAGLKLAKRDMSKKFVSRLKFTYHQADRARDLYRDKSEIDPEDLPDRFISVEKRYEDATKESEALFDEMQKMIRIMYRKGYTYTEIEDLVFSAKGVPGYFKAQILEGALLGIDEKTGRWKR